MSSRTIAEHAVVDSGREELLPLRIAQPLIGRPGRPAAKSTVLGLALQRVLDVRLIAGRYVVSRASINSYRAQRGLGPIEDAAA